MRVNEFYKHTGYSICQRARKLGARVNPTSCQDIKRAIGNDYPHINGKIYKMIYKVTVTASEQCQPIPTSFSSSWLGAGGKTGNWEEAKHFAQAWHGNSLAHLIQQHSCCGTRNSSARLCFAILHFL